MRPVLFNCYLWCTAGHEHPSGCSDQFVHSLSQCQVLMLFCNRTLIIDPCFSFQDSMNLEKETLLLAPAQAPGPREASSPASQPKSSLGRVAREAAQLGAAALSSDLCANRPASQASLLSDLRSASDLCEAPEVAPGTLDLSVIRSSQTNGPLPSQEVDASARTAFSGIMVSKRDLHILPYLMRTSITDCLD